MQAFATASHALELDPQESNCHRVLALVWLYRADYDAAEHHYRRALELNPNDADRTNGDWVTCWRCVGSPRKRWSGWSEAMRLNPFQPDLVQRSPLRIALYSLQALRRGGAGDSSEWRTSG